MVLLLDKENLHKQTFRSQSPEADMGAGTPKGKRRKLIRRIPLSEFMNKPGEALTTSPVPPYTIATVAEVPETPVPPYRQTPAPLVVSQMYMHRIVSDRWEAEIKHCKAEIKHSESRLKALEEDVRADEELRVYSDGSAIDGGVGGAAVMMEGNRMLRESRFYLGKADTHMVYEGEVVGMILAVKLFEAELKSRGGGNRTMALGVDNQAAIKALLLFWSKCSHYLINKFHDNLRSLLPNVSDGKLIIQWAAGHIGITGNEIADEQAKKAARGETSDTHLLPTSLHLPTNTPLILPTSKSTIKQSFRTMINEEAKTILKCSPCYDRFKEIDPSFLSNQFVKIANEFPRWHTALLVQLHTGHAPLNKHLFKIARVPSPMCPACEESEESVHHFLLSCPAYTRQRAILKAELGT
ncbi:uncharacterized protein F5147DRAFT_771067 [Suillus discolor]|uniref:RNase H type-1 domain-containing protein n=1 Tax=Suillus discolor TaxID=1912936 RepID=A0A9P7FBQ3_9AGAM|nr:uncharacterized protein F5147DRAFT_771067 [Suillus discolor]KAG2113217.1 hypothetical protein F5147DRAFT_771067 [Suillus discolor]